MNPTAIPIESVAYLERLVRCNEAVGDCLSIRIVTAASYEAASSALADPTMWPPTAPAAALAHPHAAGFPWLPPLFSNPQPGGRCPVWEEAATDLSACAKYIDFVYRRTRTYLSPAPPVTGRADRLSPRERAAEEFAYILWEMHRIVVGRAAEFLDRLRAGGFRSGWTWLDAALYEGNADSQLPIREERTGVRRRETTRTPTVTMTDLQPDNESRAPEPATPAADQPDAIAAKSDRDRLLREKVAALFEPERTVLRLRFWEELTWGQTATAMGCTVAAAQAHLQRALCKLRGELPDDSDD